MSRMSNEEMTNRFMASGLFPTGSIFRWKNEGPGSRRDRNDKVIFECSTCKADPVLGRWCSFEAYYGNFCKGQIPCRCGKKHIWEMDEISAAISAAVSSRGVSFVRTTGSRMVDRATLSCKEHGEFTINNRSALYLKTGCPSCANLRHDIFYIHGVYDRDVLVGLKYGLTKTNAKTSRIYLQNKNSIFSIRPLLEFFFDSPQDARDLETELKSSLPRQFTKEEVSDGYTETCSSSHLDLIISSALSAGGRKKEE